LADERLRGANGMTTGANEDGFHFNNVSLERDIVVKQWADLRVVQAGEPCVKCGKSLKMRRAIEVGHVFKLGTKYSVALGALFLDETGKQQPAVMGCYGIGARTDVQASSNKAMTPSRHHLALGVAPLPFASPPLSVNRTGGHEARGFMRS
jgi:prolyl-tRNA synthetase